MRYLKIHRHHVRSVSFSADGKQLATASNDYSGKVIDVATGLPTCVWETQGVAQCAAISPDGKLVAFAGQFPDVLVLDLESRVCKPLDVIGSGTVMCSVFGLAFSPDGQYLVSGSGDRQQVLSQTLLRIWQLPGAAVVRSEKVPGGIWDLTFDRAGEQLWLGTAHGWRVYEAGKWKMLQAIYQGKGCRAIALSPDGQTLATSAGWSVWLWDVQTQKTARKMAGHQALVTSLAFTPDGKRLLSGSWDQSVRLWDPLQGVELAAFDWQRGKVQDIAVAPDGMTAVAGCDKGVVIWDLDE